jgi:hypothetical protein
MSFKPQMFDSCASNNGIPYLQLLSDEFQTNFLEETKSHLYTLK